MTVPSYDDLTPGIPDVVESDNVNRLARFLHEDIRRRTAAQESSPRRAAGFQSSRVFACVRAAASADPLIAIARDFSPRVKRVSEGEVLLDVSGLGRLIGEPVEISRQLSRALETAGLNASVAVGPTQTIARVLARSGTGHGRTLRHQDHQGRQDHQARKNGLCDLCDPGGLCAGACGHGPWLQLPVGLLRELEVLPPGINHRDRDRPYAIFETWGIATLGDLGALPPGDLSARLGRRGVALHRLARGLDASPFVPDADTPRYLGGLELEWPIDALEPLSFVFARLLDPLTAALERADRGAAAIRLDLRLTDRSTETRLLQLPAAMRDARVLRTLLLLDLESHPLFADGAAERMIDRVTIELDPAPARITQFSLLQRALPSPETLSTLTARLSALVGETRVGSPALLDTHRPDAFEMARYAPSSAVADPGTPDLQSGGSVLRRQRGSVALHVSVERGRPVHIAASRRGIPYGAIVQAAGPWRTSGGWWLVDDVAPKGGHGGWNRNEWDVALKSGAVCRIYQNRVDDRWFLDGTYD